jgi:hypothetical protein
MIAAHDHVGGAKDVDRVTVLAAATGARTGVLDPVVGNQTAVAALVALPDANAAVAGFGDDVGRDQQAAAVVAEQRVVRGASDRVVRHFAVATFERHAVAAGAGDFAIGDADGFHVIEVHERAPGGQRLAAAVERETGERNGVRVLRRQQRRPMR